jgi:hypothetical protein
VSRYGIGLPSYWTGTTGQEIQHRGGKAATLLGAYLMFNGSMNMIGLYRVPVRTIVGETPLTRAELTKAFAVLQQAEFADYDAVTEHVWVREMARYRLGLSADSPALNPDDNRAVGAQKLYAAIDDNPFLEPFFKKYGRALHLKKMRSSTRYPNPSPLEGAWKGLREGASKPLPSQVTDHRYRDQGSGTGKSTGAARRPVQKAVEISVGTFALYCVIAEEALETSLREDQTDNLGNVAEVFKTLCARRHLAYDGELTTKALDAVLASREKKAAS